MSITESQLKTYIAKWNREPALKVAETTKKLMKEMDIDCDGRISNDEFVSEKGSNALDRAGISSVQRAIELGMRPIGASVGVGGVNLASDKLAIFSMLRHLYRMDLEDSARGDFDEILKIAIKQFQKDKGLLVQDGRIDAMNKAKTGPGTTLRLLIADVKAKGGELL